MNARNQEKLWLSAVALCLTALCMVATEGCATATDWTDLVKEAEPELSLGECGPQVTWNKTLVVYEKADVEATLVIRPHCKDKEDAPAEAPKGGPDEGSP